MTPAPASRNSLATFRNPESVTVVGASADPTKWGYWLARGALNGARHRPVHLVNSRAAVIEGQQSLRSIDEVPGNLDLVVLCVPAPAVPEVVRAALEKGARGFLGITAGLDRALQQPGAERELAQLIRDRGARIVGPNCLGIYDAAADLQLAWGEFCPGSLGIISQSGQLGSELSNLAAERGLGVSRFVSVGNQVDVTAREALADLIDHEPTRVVGLYVESFVDGRRMVQTLRALREAGKHTILLTVGASEASRSAAQSHTGAMTSALDVVDAACRAAGVVRVDTPAQLVDVAQMLLDAPLPAGPRVAVVGDSGGQGAVAADVLGARGLQLQRLPEATVEKLTELLPPDAGLNNPIDLAGGGEQGLGTYAAVVETLLAEPAVDAVTLTGYFGSYGFHTPSIAALEQQVAEQIAAAAKQYGKPVVLHSMCRQSRTIDRLRELGVPTYLTIEAAALSLGHALQVAGNPGREPVLPTSEPATGPLDGYLDYRRLLQNVGIRFPDAERVENVDQVLAAAGRLRAPYVLKADWILHKTEVGGVVLRLDDADSARKAFEKMSARLGPGAYVLEEMDRRPNTVELIVGARRDPVFGPVVLVGAGGVQAELFRDTALELAPVDVSTVAAMLRRLRSHALLIGWRGKPAVDLDDLVRAVVAVSDLICQLPECSDIELNPVRVGPDGVLAVDALVTLHSNDTRQEEA
ncbi:MAG TPA: acetate--CoA ligase family protein [Micromonosporaceae bacterium]|nr:acetate--CoA ligase family protein [Micromonosporaceae bacterium]